LAKGLKQSDIEGLSERQVRRIEKVRGTTYEALRRLAAAHHMNLEKYLQEMAARVPVPTGERAYFRGRLFRHWRRVFPHHRRNRSYPVKRKEQE
jgi:hypothetical protein